MPVFNTEETLFKASVNSVLCQNFSDYELLIVDDGSSPEIAALCDEFASLNHRIMVFHQTNQGASTARNVGLEESCGDYVMYMDSDDILTEDTLSECAEIIKQTNADFIFAGAKRVYDSSKFTIRTKDKPEYTVFTEKDIEYIKVSLLAQNNPQFLNVDGSGVVYRGPCAKAVKRCIAKQVFFEKDLTIGEDVLWNMQVLTIAKSACFVNRIWYVYVHNKKSVIRRYYENRHEIEGKYLQKLYLKHTEFCEKYKKEYLSNMAVAFHRVLKKEFMTEMCPLTEAEKRVKVKQIINSQPWACLKKDKKLLNFKHRVLVDSSQLGCVFLILKIFKK